MKTFNIYRLIEACPFKDKLTEGAKDALADFIDEVYECINDVNIDDIIINGIYIIDEDEYMADTNNYYLLYIEGDDYYVMP